MRQRAGRFAALLFLSGFASSLLLAACGGSTTTPTTPVSGNTPSTNACNVLAGGQSQLAIINGADCSTANSSVVLLNRRDAGNDPLGRCSGIVIAPRAVLTAAHCLTDVSVTNIFLGTGDQIPATEMHVDPNYRPNDSTSEDIGVVLTGQDIPRRPFALLASRDVIVGEPAVIAGWGIDETGGFSGTVRAGMTTISANGLYFLQTQYLDNGSNSGACGGDSGGPLLVHQGSAWVVAGVTSAISGTACTVAGTNYFANVRNPGIASFISGLVPAVTGR